MGVADRLITTNTGDGNDGVMEAPGVIPRDGDFDSTSEFRDVRGNRVQVVTMSSFGGTDSFTLGVRIPNSGYQTSIAFVRGTNATAAAIQAELRTLTGDSALTVTGTTDAGPFTITHTVATFLRDFPRYVVNGTGCTGVVAALPDPEGDGTIGALGESHRVSETDTILKPTIGTITVTDSTHQIDTLDYASGTAGGTFAMRTGGGGVVSGIAWDAEAATIEAALDARAASGANSQVTVAKRGTNEVQTLTLSSWDGGDTIKLTFDGHESSAVAQASDVTALLQTEIDAILALSDDFTLYNAGDCVVTRTSATVYVFTFSGAGVEKRNVGAITATSGTGSATGAVVETTPGVHDGYTFTHDNAVATPSTGITLDSQALTDGSSTAKTAVFTSGSTAGVLGSASAAYTENGAGDSVLASAVNDTTGKSYGFVKDAATPVVVASLPPGTYHMILRTVEDGRVSKADTKAFTVT